MVTEPPPFDPDWSIVQCRTCGKDWGNGTAHVCRTWPVLFLQALYVVLGAASVVVLIYPLLIQ